MTGDGAVVRMDAELARKHANEVLGWENHAGEVGYQYVNLARAYLAQAAEIERLTGEKNNWMQAAGYWRPRAEASEARNADLLKALRKVAIVSRRSRSKGVGIACRLCHRQWTRNDVEHHDADCLAAAKGETV